MAGLVKDYETYKKNRNVTFIGICTSTTASVKSMEQQVDQFKLKPFANMLDAGGATAVAYGVPKNARFWLVVIDGGGKIAYNASKGWSWGGTGPLAGRSIHSTQIEKSLQDYPEGILGAAKPPADMETAAHYYDLQQFNLLEAELRKASAPASKEFAGLIRQRIADTRVWRKDQIEAFAKTDPVQAYREAMAFVAAFPNAPERAAVNESGRALLKLPEVKKEIDAEAAYQRMLVPEMKKTTTKDRYAKMVQPLLDAYLRSYGSTQYAAAVKNACEAHRLAVETATP